MTGPLLAHRLDGQGEPLLLLNGGLMSYTAWDALVPAFARRFTVVRCDLRGQLRSRGRTPDTIEGHVGDLVELLDHLGLERVHVVSTSFGGLVGLALAALAPSRVATLAATATGPTTAREYGPLARELAAACRAASLGGPVGPVAEVSVEAFYSPAFAAAHAAELAAGAKLLEMMEPWWWANVVAILEAMRRFDPEPLLPLIHCPTLVLAAELDLLFPPELVRSLAAGIAGARFAVVPGSGHVLIRERPEELTRHCLEFLSSVSCCPTQNPPVSGQECPDPKTAEE